MPSPIEEIKSRLDIVEFIQGYIRLQKAGVNFRANCPFHGEKTPSFFVSPVRQIWHCFGCSRGGDIFKFIMEMEGQDFPEALRLLAARAGVVLKREDPAIRSERNRLYEVCEHAARIFEKSLSLTPGARTYLAGRGVSPETITKFRIGFAPQSWDFLLMHLGRAGFTKEEIERAGMAIKSQDGSSWYDRFRSRIMFPITDANARVIGFGGRIFSADGGVKSDEAKYINTPQTAIYDKSRVLYAFDKAKGEIRGANAVVVVEGYMDCVMSHQAGIANTIAVSGTALTPAQLTTLRRLCGKIICSFDADAAGESATRRSLALAAEFDFDRRIAEISSGKDPADAAKENPQAWRDATEHASGVVDFYFARAFGRFDPRTAEGKKSITDMILPFIAELADEIQKAHWVRQFAVRSDIPEEAVWKELGRVGRANGGSRPRPEINIQDPRLISNRREKLEDQLLLLLASAGSGVGEGASDTLHLRFRSPQNARLFGLLSGATDPGLATPEEKEAIGILTFKSEVFAETIPDVIKEFYSCRHALQRECIKERLSELEGKIRAHESAGDTDALTEVMTEFRVLATALKASN